MFSVGGGFIRPVFLVSYIVNWYDINFLNQLTNPKRDTIHEIRDTYLVVCEKKYNYFQKK